MRYQKHYGKKTTTQLEHIAELWEAVAEQAPSRHECLVMLKAIAGDEEFPEVVRFAAKGRAA